MKQLLSLMLALSLTSAPLHAQEAKEDATDQLQPETETNKTAETAVKAPEDEAGAPSKGTGKLVPGIVTASVGTGFGLLLVALSRVNCNDLTKDRDKNDDAENPSKTDDDVKDCEKLKPTYRKLGAASIVVGLGVGLPFIYFGIEDRKAYNQWKSQQPEDKQSSNGRAGGHADLVLLQNMQSDYLPGVGLTLNF